MNDLRLTNIFRHRLALPWRTRDGLLGLDFACSTFVFSLLGVAYWLPKRNEKRVAITAGMGLGSSWILSLESGRIPCRRWSKLASCNARKELGSASETVSRRKGTKKKRK